MPRFSANLAMPFRARPFVERLGAARAAGFEAVEMPFPYAAPLEDLARSHGYAAERLAGDGITVLLEAVNRRERPSYLIATTDEALEAMALTGHANIRLEHDLYHLQIMEGDLTHRLERVCDRIGHIQFADSPGRHQPGTGEIDYDHIFTVIDRLDYGGWCGAEYFPTTERTEDSLAWIEPYRR